jgi:hypothetical protein
MASGSIFPERLFHMRVDWQVFQSGSFRAEAQMLRAEERAAGRALLF